jgi:hypothetical protein
MYAKVFSQIYDGSLCTHSRWEALVTFQQMLVLADQDGVVDMTAEAISRRTTIPLEIIKTGISELMAPDPHSRTPAEDGRRIIPLCEGRVWGWRVVNYRHYRDLKREVDRREYHREYWHKRKSLNATQHPQPNQPIAEAEEEAVKRPLSSNEDKCRNAKRSDPIPFEKIVDLYHETLPMLPRVVALTPNRKAQIRGRYATGAVEDLEDWKTFFRLVAGSAFLTGRSQPSNGRKPFRADLAWLTKEENFMKILEEKYS